MKHFKVILVSCVVAGILAAFGYQLLPPSDAGRRAVNQLRTVQRFSLGPVGSSGCTSAGENAFFTILESRHASRLFRDLYERGTPEAKVYALCGLHLTRGGFEAYAARFSREATVVSWQGGCIVGEHSPSEAVAFITRGEIERYLSLYQEEQRTIASTAR